MMKKCNVFKTQEGYYEYVNNQFLRLHRFDEWFKTFPNVDFSVVIYNDLNEIGYCWDETQEVDRLVQLKKHDDKFFLRKYFFNKY